jgi:hypothetical protein
VIDSNRNFLALTDKNFFYVSSMRYARLFGATEIIALDADEFLAPLPRVRARLGQLRSKRSPRSKQN